MKRKVARLKLSPNEEARIIREEYERRRKLRIQQVVLVLKFYFLQNCKNRHVFLAIVTMFYSFEVSKN